MNESRNITVEVNNRLLTIKYPDITYSYWKVRKPFNNDKDIQVILDELLIQLDCSIVYSGQRLLYTNQMMYDYYISEYYYYMLRFTNQIIYNWYFDFLLQRHDDNITYEINNVIVAKPVVEKTKTKSTKKVVNKFVRQVTKDMFTGEETYLYSNSKTGELIQSEDSNLLEELNAPKKKVKQAKVTGVSMDAMTFSFKKS